MVQKSEYAIVGQVQCERVVTVSASAIRVELVSGFIIVSRKTFVLAKPLLSGIVNVRVYGN